MADCKCKKEWFWDPTFAQTFRDKDGKECKEQVFVNADGVTISALYCDCGLPLAFSYSQEIAGNPMETTIYDHPDFRDADWLGEDCWAVA